MLNTLQSFALQIIRILFTILPTLPNVPQELRLSIYDFIDLIISRGGALLGVFVRISTLQIIVTLYLLVLSADIIYKIVTWLLHKLPINIS